MPPRELFDGGFASRVSGVWATASSNCWPVILPSAIRASIASWLFSPALSVARLLPAVGVALVTEPTRDREAADQGGDDALEKNERAGARLKIAIVDFRIVRVPEGFLNSQHQAKAVAEATEGMSTPSGFGHPGGDLQILRLPLEELSAEFDDAFPVSDLGLALPVSWRVSSSDRRARALIVNELVGEACPAGFSSEMGRRHSSTLNVDVVDIFRIHPPADPRPAIPDPIRTPTRSSCLLSAETGPGQVPGASAPLPRPARTCGPHLE